MKKLLIVLLIFFCDMACCQAASFFMDDIFLLQIPDNRSGICSVVPPDTGHTLSLTAGWSPVWSGLPVHEAFTSVRYRRFTYSFRWQGHKLMRTGRSSLSYTVAALEDLCLLLRLDHGFCQVQGYATDHDLNISGAWRLDLGGKAALYMIYDHFYCPYMSASRILESSLVLAGSLDLTDDFTVVTVLEKTDPYVWRVNVGAALRLFEYSIFRAGVEAGSGRITAGIQVAFSDFQIIQNAVFHPELGCGSLSCVSWIK